MENSNIYKFIKANSTLLSGIPVSRCLNINTGMEELYVLECAEYKGKRRTYIFRFDCGELWECKTEINTFENYLVLIPTSTYTEYINFNN